MKAYYVSAYYVLTRSIIFLILDHFNNDAEINLFHERPTDAVGATVTTGVNDDEPDVSEIHQNQQANTD